MSNPTGINQYTKGGAGRRSSSKAHAAAKKVNPVDLRRQFSMSLAPPSAPYFRKKLAADIKAARKAGTAISSDTARAAVHSTQSRNSTRKWRASQYK